ncbi:hypothetical protein FRC09_020560 [Ceratobasidium sp. 395]|nr:hypothetical protein FRC09_020560 [Ceratobasidium sp. 395]
MAIAVYGVIVFPDTPQTTRAFYLTPEDRELARSRIPRRPKAKLDKAAAISIFKGWRYWMFSLIFVFTSQLEAYGTNGIVAIWLTQDKIVGPPKNSYYALGLIAVAIFTTILAGLATDIWGGRWRVNIFMGVALLISSIMLLVWDIPLGAKYFAFCKYLSLMQSSKAIRARLQISADADTPGKELISLGPTKCLAQTLSDLVVILYSMNLWSNAFQAWWILLIWPVSSAPRYRRGMISTIPISIILMLLGWITHILHRRSMREDESVRSNESLHESEEHGDTDPHANGSPKL